MLEISLAKDFRVALDQLLSFVGIVSDADGFREDFVRSHPDQRSYGIKRHVVAGFRERVQPGPCVCVVAVYERAVDVEDCAFEQ
jgi:hypothetical protein